MRKPGRNEYARDDANRYVVDHGSYGEEIRDTHTDTVVAECKYGEGLTDEQVAANAERLASDLNGG